MNILFEDNHLLVVEKPVNIPVQADESGDADMLTLLKEGIKKRYNKPGNVYLGLVHRLDRPVGGVMVFARTSKAASRLSEQVRRHAMQKVYRAVLCGELTKQATWANRLSANLRDGKIRVVGESDDCAKPAELTIKPLANAKGHTLAEIELKTGRKHQIRVQTAHRNLALWGDQRYNVAATPGHQIALWAHTIRFEHPTQKESLIFTSNPPRSAPWNWFHV